MSCGVMVNVCIVPDYVNKKTVIITFFNFFCFFPVFPLLKCEKQCNIAGVQLLAQIVIIDSES